MVIEQTKQQSRQQPGPGAYEDPDAVRGHEGLLVSEWMTLDKARASIIWLHGLGTSGADLDPLLPQLRRVNRIGLNHVVPHAPVREVTVNQGGLMRAWFDQLALGPDAPEDEAGIRAAAEQVQGLIRQQIRRGIPAERIVLVGYSQGAAMALHAGLGFPERLAGVVALSGYLPLVDRWQAFRDPANAETPVFMAHGTQDEVMDYGRAERAAYALADGGHPVVWERYDMGHQVCGEELEALDSWLMDRLG
ncbi:phospholipase/carboxylesterase [Alkalispirillum mobile]|uniref:Phospholipase/carboxylesterase n=1 Tax=Alkalispirillum mobile TaxID=85925 RepID=A0A498C6V2_9GAMM|nr:alpha/beta fold hydrolase [Alkalispirillum mobile]RLK48820.1 phospholipase/carboxylesterase [Alkalispirillum mobile]